MNRAQKATWKLWEAVNTFSAIICRLVLKELNKLMKPK